LVKISEQFEKFNGVDPTYSDLALASGLSVKRVKELLSSIQATTSLDCPLSDTEDDDNTVLNLIADDRALPSDIVSEKVFNEQLEALISSSLDAREVEVIKGRHELFGGDEETLSAIGKKLGIFCERTRQIQSAIYDKIKARAFGDNTMDGLVDALSQLLAESVAVHCAICGKELTPDDSKYCSDKCRQKVMMQNSKKRRCVVCGSPIPSRARKYCCRECRLDARATRRRR